MVETWIKFPTLPDRVEPIDLYFPGAFPMKRVFVQ